jgi:site-specific recombinase XerD
VTSEHYAAELNGGAGRTDEAIMAKKSMKNAKALGHQGGRFTANTRRAATTNSVTHLLRTVFVSERGAPFSTAGFGRMIERTAEADGLEIKTHARMLRHACGFALANAGHDTRSLQAYLVHRNIQHTVRYT